MDGNMQANIGGNVVPGTFGPLPQQIPPTPQPVQWGPQPAQWGPQPSQLETQGILGGIAGGLAGSAIGGKIGGKWGRVVGGIGGRIIGGAVIPFSDPTAMALAQQAELAQQQADWAQQQGQVVPHGWWDTVKSVGGRVLKTAAQIALEEAKKRAGDILSRMDVDPTAAALAQQAQMVLQQAELAQQQAEAAQQAQPAPQQFAPQLFAPPQSGGFPFNPWLSRVA